MAQMAFEYKILTGKADDELTKQLGALSASSGWTVANMTSIDHDVVILLRREKDFEVAQSLQQALESTMEELEEPPSITDAIGQHLDPP